MSARGLSIAIIVLVAGCGSEADPGPTVEDALLDAAIDSSIDASIDSSTPDDTTVPADAAEESAPEDTRDASADTRGDTAVVDANVSDAAVVDLGVVDDVHDAPFDVAATETRSDAPDAPVAPDAFDALDAASIDTADTQGDTTVTDAVEAAVDAVDAFDAFEAAPCAPDACASGGFPGSELVNGAQGAMINGWVGTPTQEWKLCYSTALHVKSGQQFHTNCAYKGVSVSIARVSANGNTRVIGGYSNGSWTTPATQGYSPWTGSFLFSVTNSFKHDPPGSFANSNFLVFQNQYYGPTFGAGPDLYVHSQMTMGTCFPGYSYGCRVGASGEQCNVDFCGTKTSSEFFALELLEVWIK